MTFEELKHETSKVKNLDELLELWKEAHSKENDEDWIITQGTSHNIPKSNFIGDGIIDPEIFNKEKIRILFISNEANIDKPEYKKAEDRRKSFNEYYNKQYDNWKGKMRERICAIFNELIQEPSTEYYKSAKRFAFMNINKRGGNNQVGDGTHIEKYCELYRDFIKKEIEMINPELIVWLGIKTYNMNLLQNIGTHYKGNILFININEKYIPIMKMWHTSNWQCSKNSLNNYCEVEKKYISIGINNKLIIKLAAKARLEYDLLSV